MAAWTGDELTRIGNSEEVGVAATRGDGSPRNRVTIWLVRTGDDLYVRSAVNGRNAAWFRAVQEGGRGRMWAAGLQKDVKFETADQALEGKIDAAYRDKYRRYAGRILNSCLTPDARSTTLKVLPS